MTTVPDAEITVDPDEYAGPATVSTASGEVQVEVTLHSWFEPIDGQTHWVGRIAASDDLAALCSSGTSVRITAGDTSAEGRLSDVDPWGRFRITGTGRAPIPGQ